MADYEFAGRYGPEIFMDSNQALLRNKPVTVYEKGTNTLATLYTDRTKSSTGPNPFFTDIRGNGSFYAEPNEYDISVDGHRFTVTVMIDFEDLAVGSPGPAGEPGAPGEPGTPGIPWVYSSATTDADPGSGNLRFNNANPSSATFIYVDDVCASGVNVATWLATFDDNLNNTVKGDLSIMNADRSAIRQYMVTGNIVDGGTYMKIPVQFLGGGGTFTASEELFLNFARAGDLSDLDEEEAETIIRGLGFIMSPDGSVTDIVIADEPVSEGEAGFIYFEPVEEAP